MSEKKPKIPLAEQHRALHAAINMTEKRWDDQIEKAIPTLDDARVTELRTRKVAHMAALEALQRTWDFVIEFPDEFRIFVKELAEKRAQKKAAA